MWDFLSDVIRTTLSGFAERLRAFGPDLLAMLVILSLGLLAAVALRALLRRLLPRLGFDRFASRLGVSLMLNKGGLTQSPADVVASATAWGVLAVAVLLAIGSLNLRFGVNPLSQAFGYLPQLLVAAALLLLGSLLGGFLRRSVLIAAVNAGLPSARLLAGGAQAGVLFLCIAMALEQLGVGRQVILVAFTILFGGVVLALSLAFGLAGRELARELLEKLFRRNSDGSGDPLRHL